MFCEKCGKEINNEAVICPNCGCSTGIGNEISTAKGKYEKVLMSTNTYLGVSILLFVIGIGLFLFRMYLMFSGELSLAIILKVLTFACLFASEFVALAPKNKINKIFRENNYNLLISNKQEFKVKAKENYNQLKLQNSTLSILFGIAILAMILGILSLFI